MLQINAATARLVSIVPRTRLYMHNYDAQQGTFVQLERPSPREGVLWAHTVQRVKLSLGTALREHTTMSRATQNVIFVRRDTTARRKQAFLRFVRKEVIAYRLHVVLHSGNVQQEHSTVVQAQKISRSAHLARPVRIVT